MRATDFFQQYYQCHTLAELINYLCESTYIPPYLCAHPRPSYLQQIEECSFIDIVRPCTVEDVIICICQPTIVEPSTTGSERARLNLIQQIWSEPIYLPLEDLEICPMNKENVCQMKQR